MFGFGGDDTLTVNYNLLIPNTTTIPPVADWKLFGGYGADKLTVNANINFGSNPNFDWFNFYTANSLFAGDAGNDTITGTIRLNSNPVGYPFGGGSNITQVAMDSGGSNKVTLTSSAYVADGMNTLTHIVETGSGKDVISSTTSADGENYRTAAMIHIDAGDGTNTITVKDTSGDLVLDVISGAGADTLNITLNADPGNAEGYDALGNIATGGGNDVVNLTFGGFHDGLSDVDFTIDLGNGNNTLNVAAKQGGNFDIDSYGQNDIINVSFANPIAYEVSDLYVNVNAGQGNNTVKLNLFDLDTSDSVVSHADVDTGDGTDYIELLYGTNSTVESYGGTDTIKAFGTSETVKAGAGNDVIYIQSGSDTVTGGLGADTFRFTDAAGVNFAGDTHDIDLNFAQGDKLVFSGAFAGSGSVLGSIAQLTAFDTANANFTYFNLGSVATTVGDKITFTDTGGDLVTILL
ncbi:MAG: calcium-binding protein [Paracoccaceae bacterium]